MKYFITASNNMPLGNLHWRLLLHINETHLEKNMRY